MTKTLPLLLMLKGLPASGKTTFALKLVDIGWKRVNKDDLRSMIDGGKWSKDNEKNILEARDLLIIQYLDEGYNVVVDDTNLDPVHSKTLSEIAENCNAVYDEKFFNITLMEAIERDSKRGDKSVGGKVIQGMYDKYLRPEPPIFNPALSSCYMVDIDGTIAKMNGRSPYDYSKVDTDITHQSIVDIIKVIGQFTRIVIVSGRKDECKEQTIKWLKDKEIPFSELHMRKTGDDREDSIVKSEIYDKYIKNKYNVSAVFDDRNRVCAMWRSLGLTCLQVDYGNF